MISTSYPGSRILVADDEPANVALLTKMLKRAGYYNIASTTDSGNVMRLVTTFEPDLLMLDLHMPDPDGFALMIELDQTRTDDEFLPVLVLTADGTEVTKIRALRGGATDFLAKPFDYPELLLRAENLVTLRQQHEQLRRANISMTTTIEANQRRSVAREERARAITLRTEKILAESGPRMVYQPIINLSDGAVVSFEALARFTDDPEDDPEVWFAEAHEVELGVQLELAALSAAIRGIEQLPADCDVALNASPKTLRSPALRYVLEDAPTDRIVLEVTEHESVQDYRTLVESIADLRTRGVRIAVDDTGSGSASLHHILELRPEIVKLDRSLVQDIDHSPVRRSLVAALQHFSSEMDLELIAEGIETIEQFQTVKSLGINLGQGFLLGHPSDLPVPTPQLPTPHSSV